jgi:uncharacterized membrane protein YgcG
MPDPVHHRMAARTFPVYGRLPFSLLLFISMMPYSFFPAFAEVRVVSSQGEYRLGDRDTKEDAVRLATEAAKRNALEQVATYLESVTVVEGTDITKDEIRTYTAGLVLVLDQQTNLTLEGDTVVVTVDLMAQVDTEEVAHAIVALRENEEARHQLVALKTEIDDLHKELESATQALAGATTAEQAQQASLQRQDILNRVQSNAMVAQAWTDWVIVAPVVYPYPWVGVAQTQALLNAAHGLYPASPYVQAAQQSIVAKQPPLPAQPPIPPTTTQSVPHQLGVRQVPLTLNEISHTTPTSPMHLGNQPAGATQGTPAPTGSRTLTDIRQLNPFLSPPGGMPHAGQQTVLGSRSAQSLQQFLKPPATVPPSGQPPVARRLPPTINQIHPPLPHQVPRVPYHLAPRSSGGGGHYGGGGRGAGGGGGRSGGGGHGGGRGR